MNKLDELKNVIEDMQVDYLKFFEKGINSSASKLRKKLQVLRKLAQDLRVEIQNVKTQRKTKTENQ